MNKKDFPIFENQKITYLDSAATSQKPKQVIKSMINFYENNNANIHRGIYELSENATIILVASSSVNPLLIK